MTLMLNTGGAGTPATRSLSQADEKTIDNVSVLLFRRSSSSEEGTLSYQAQTSEVTQDDSGTYSAVVKLQQSVSGEEYSVVIIANCGTDIGYQYYGQTKSYVQQHLLYAYTDRWAAKLDGSGEMKSFPMWGETAYEVLGKTSSYNGKKSIRMLRALARMDVGLKYKRTSGGENYEGIENYRMETVHVYRVPKTGFVIPVATNYSDTLVSAPSVPSEVALWYPAAAGSGEKGFIYTADVEGTESGLASGLERSIYLPENSVSTDEKNTALVVGITNLTSGRLSYYKLKMKSNTTSGNTEPVLRNYRYVYSITSITSVGYETPEDALNGMDGGVDYSVLVWNDITADLWASGNYFFKVDKQEVILPSYASNNVTVTYTTNLPANRIAWTWAAGSPKTSALTYTDEQTVSDGIITGTLTFSAPGNNTGALREDVLTFTAGDLVGEVNISQRFVSMAYTLDCSSVQLYGSYLPDTVPDATSHFITLTLQNITQDMLGQEWHLWTDEKSNLSFDATGTFNTVGDMEVVLPVVEKQLASAGKFKLTIYANNNPATICEDAIDITIGFKKKKLLCIEYTEKYYGTGGGSGESREFLNDARNFSLTTAGAFPVDGFDITYINSALAMSTSVRTYLESSNPPDIVINATTYFDNSTFNTAFTNYINRGGVFIWLSETVTIGPINYMYPAIFHTPENVPMAQPTTASNAPGAYVTIHEVVDPSVKKNDPIISGVLGGKKYNESIEELYWGTDATHSGGIFLNIPDNYKDEFAVYSTYDGYYQDGFGTRVRQAAYEGWATFIRSKHTNVVFMGDSGVLADVDPTRLESPYLLDANNQPAIQYNIRNAKAPNGVSNSAIFRNIMAWAVYQAENHGINSGGPDPFGE
jgi:hypothetical protein